jgi:hypothetical protein
MTPQWKLHQDHDEEIRNCLKEAKCMGPRNEIRRWTREAWSLIEECGHTSLDFKKCECRNSPF